MKSRHLPEVGDPLSGEAHAGIPERIDAREREIERTVNAAKALEGEFCLDPAAMGTRRALPLEVRDRRIWGVAVPRSSYGIRLRQALLKRGTLRGDPLSLLTCRAA